MERSLVEKRSFFFLRTRNAHKLRTSEREHASFFFFRVRVFVCVCVCGTYVRWVAWVDEGKETERERGKDSIFFFLSFFLFFYFFLMDLHVGEQMETSREKVKEKKRIPSRSTNGHGMDGWCRMVQPTNHPSFDASCSPSVSIPLSVSLLSSSPSHSLSPSLSVSLLSPSLSLSLSLCLVSPSPSLPQEPPLRTSSSFSWVMMVGGCYRVTKGCMG